MTQEKLKQFLDACYDAKRLVEHLPDLPSHTLDSVAAHFGFTFKHHDALDDAIACARIVANTGLQKKFIRKFEFSPNME